MEILNQLLSSQIDYLNALRHAQEMPPASPPDSGNGIKFKINGKFLVRVLTVVGIIYFGFQIYKFHIRESIEEEG